MRAVGPLGLGFEFKLNGSFVSAPSWVPELSRQVSVLKWAGLSALGGCPRGRRNRSPRADSKARVQTRVSANSLFSELQSRVPGQA